MELLDCRVCNQKPSSGTDDNGWGASVVSCMRCKISVRGKYPCSSKNDKEKTAEQKWNELMLANKPIAYVNKIVFGQQHIERKHDMSPAGSMLLMPDCDGDMCISIFDDEKQSVSDAEFCTPFSGGGGSRRTHAALRELFVAMFEDQVLKVCSNRDGRWECADDLRPLAESLLKEFIHG